MTTPPDPNPPPEPTPEPSGNVLTQAEVKATVMEALDERLEALDLTGKLSKLEILDDLESKIAGLFETHKTAAVDQPGLLKEIDNLIANRIKNPSAPVGAKREGGWLSRWLTPDAG